MSRREDFSMRLAQDRGVSWFLAVFFAGVAVLFAWPWPTQTYQAEVVVMIVVNAVLAAICLRQARKRVTITDREVIVANWNRTICIPLSEVRIFAPHVPRRSSRIAVRPVLECQDGRIVRLDALFPALGTDRSAIRPRASSPALGEPGSVDGDIIEALRKLNHELSTRQGASIKRRRD